MFGPTKTLEALAPQGQRVTETLRHLLGRGCDRVPALVMAKGHVIDGIPRGTPRRHRQDPVPYKTKEAVEILAP